MKNLTKKIILTSVAILPLAFALNGYANAAQVYTEAETQKLVKICQAAKSDEVFKLTKAARQANLSYQQVAYDVMCDGDDVIDFAAKNNAYKTADFLAKKVGRVVIQDLAKNTVN